MPFAAEGVFIRDTAVETLRTRNPKVLRSLTAYPTLYPVLYPVIYPDLQVIETPSGAHLAKSELQHEIAHSQY